MPNPENIIPPKKGEIRNPNGKPKGTKNRSTLLKEWLACKIETAHPETKELIKITLEDAIELAIIKKAADGDVQAYKEIKDTLHGKIQEKIDHSNSDGTLQRQGICKAFEISEDEPAQPKS